MLPVLALISPRGPRSFASRDDSGAVGYNVLANWFGAGTLSPLDILFVAPTGGTVLSAAFFDAVAAAVAAFSTLGVAPADFTGALYANSAPVPLAAVAACLAPGSPAAHTPACVEAARYISADGTATYLTLSMAFDPYTSAGKAWLDAARASATALEATNGGVSIYIAGEAAVQIDVVNAVFASFGGVIGIVLTICFVVIGVAFRSLVVPLRATATIALTLAITYGLATLVYDDGAFEGLGAPALAGGGLIYMGPVLAFAVVVGFGLGACVRGCVCVCVCVCVRVCVCVLA